MLKSTEVTTNALKLKDNKSKWFLMIEGSKFSSVNSTSLVVTMSVDELKCDDQLSTGIITAISVCIGAALVAGIAGVVFFKQRHNRRLTKLRKTFSNHHQGADVGMQVVSPSPLGSVSAAVV